MNQSTKKNLKKNINSNKKSITSKSSKAKSTLKNKSKSPSKEVVKIPRKSRVSSGVITQVEDFVYRARVGDRSEVYLVGTAHVSKKSVELVKQTLNRYRPNVVYLELDEERRKSLTRNHYHDMDILKIIKNQKILFFVFYLVMGIIQKKMAEKYGTQPGGEFLAALEWADTHKRDVVLVDRSAQVSVKRTWRLMGLKEQFRFLFSGLLSAEVEKEFDVENMKEDDILTDLIKKLGVRFPGIKKIVIDERDAYMSYRIINHVKEIETASPKSNQRVPKKGRSNPKKGIRGLAVVGAGHLSGMKEFFISQPLEWDVMRCLQVPPPHRFWQILPWAFTGIIAVVFFVGFWYSDWNTIKEAFLAWMLITGGLSALGTLVAGGHPLTILTALVSAPITTLHPVLGVGFFTAIVQFYFSPPRMKDFDTLSFKLGHFASWWHNRITRIFLVFLFSSLGAGLGMWIALSQVIAVFS